MISRGHLGAMLVIVAVVGCTSVTPSNPTPASSPHSQPPEASASPALASGPPSPPPIDMATRPQTWFAPLPAYVPHMGYDGSVDFDDLFAASAPWTTAQAHVQVFEIPSSWVMNYATADELRQLVAGVRERGIALALGIGAFSITAGCGSGIEGFDFGLEPLQKIAAAGGHVDVVVFDESWAFSSDLYDAPNACHWSTQEAAQHVVPFIRQLRGYAPDIVIGDTEPLWTNVTPERMLEWTDTYAAATGEPLGFLQVDVDWDHRADWPSAVRSIEAGAHARGIEFGPIYNGGDAVSDAEWVDLTLQRAFTYEEVAGGRPDQVILQSWMDHPDHVLPETDPSTFSGLINRYFAPRTQMAVTVDGASTDHVTLSSTLSTTDGAPIANAPLTASLQPVGSDYQVLHFNGRVPDGVSSAIIAFRVNTEGARSGSANLRIYSVGFTQGGSDTNLVGNGHFARGEADWGSYGTGKASVVSSDRGAGQMLKLRASPDESINVDHPEFAVSPGSEYTLEVAAAVPAESVGTGYIAVIWVGATEVDRDRLFLTPQPIELDGATTNERGDATFDQQLALESGRYVVTISDAGAADHWPAYVEHQVDVR
jgi:hypothetical protein